jgi:Alpha-N-acetylglucosaminidase (NAGLU) C-terminal domain
MAATQKEIDITSGTWSYDLTDLTRQVLCNIFSDAHSLLAARWTSAQILGINNTNEILTLSKYLLDIIVDLDRVNAADQNCMFLVVGFVCI